MKAQAAFLAAQKKFRPALKTSSNPRFETKYVDLRACIEAVIDALHQAGLALMQKTDVCKDGVLVETVFIHESGETLSAGQLYIPMPKADPQAFGAALTYARRYSLMAACGIAPEDDDGNAASAAAEEASVDAAIARLQASTSIEELTSAWKEEVARMRPGSKAYHALKAAASKRKAELNGADR